MGRAVGPQGEEFFGIAELIHNHQVKRVIATHVGMTPEVGQQHTEGTLEVNLLPQGTLAECIRAAGAGLGGVLTPVGIDTLVEESPFCLGRKTVDEMCIRDRAKVVRIAKELGREIATPAEAREILSLKPLQ